ncbi:MAG: hypothetical protein C4519_17320 [Desulfobacteraceae bacterium]|nr:MAG: hypothetical protein C4519_17320 [Desulfobacteraceae bacterium]
MKKLLVVLLVLGLAAPAMAADFFFYGSIRNHLGYFKASEDFIGGPGMDGTIAGGAGAVGEDSDSGTLLSIGTSTRIGAKAVASDKLTAIVEIGFQETSRTAGQIQDVYLRQIFGIWNFGAGKLLAGKTYTPGTFLGYSNSHGDMGDSGDANLLVQGLPYIGRQPLLELQFGTFELAFIENNSTAPTYTVGGVALTDRDFYLPRVEAAYVFRTPVLALRPVLGFQTYKVENAAGTVDESITSYLAGLGVSVTLGPAYVKATASYMQNAGNYGQTQLQLVNPLVAITNAQAVGADIEDSKLLQATLVVGMKFNPAFGIEAGISYANAQVDIAAGVEAEQTGFYYYLQAPIAVAKGVQIIPEIGWLDRGDLERTGAADLDNGKLAFLDVNFRIDF